MWIMKYFKPYLAKVLGIIVLQALWMGTMTVESIYFGNGITDIANGRSNAFLMDMGIAVIANLSYVLLMPLNYSLIERIKQRIETDIRGDIGESIKNVGYQDVVENDSSKYVSWMTNDMNTIDNSGIENVFDITQLAVTLIINAIVLTRYSGILMFSIIVMAVLMFLAPKLLKKQLNNRAKEFSLANEELTENLSDLLGGYSALNILGIKNLIT